MFKKSYAFQIVQDIQHNPAQLRYLQHKAILLFFPNYSQMFILTGTLIRFWKSPNDHYLPDIKPQRFH